MFNIRNWDHCTKNLTIKYGIGRRDKETTVVMMVLGAEPKDGSKPLNLEAQMNTLGWVKAKPKRVRKKKNEADTGDTRR